VLRGAQAPRGDGRGCARRACWRSRVRPGPSSS
jgi:hypothetical protein